MYGHCSDFRKHEKYANNRQKDDLIKISEKNTVSAGFEPMIS